MKKNFKFYALLLVLIVAAVIYFVPQGDSFLADSALNILETVDVFMEPISQSEDAEELSLPDREEGQSAAIDEDGWYYSKEDVALYIHTYGHLPGNYIGKNEAEKAGWTGGSVEKYFPGMAIGGSRFGNYEGLLPKASGRTWTECDINTNGKSSRGAERIVFSNDGLIYYTGDHYESFELLYGEE